MLVDWLWDKVLKLGDLRNQVEIEAIYKILMKKKLYKFYILGFFLYQKCRNVATMLHTVALLL